MSKTVKTVGIVNAYNETAGPLTVLKSFLKHFDEPLFRIILFIPKGKQQFHFNNRNIKIVYTEAAPIDKDIFSIKAVTYFFTAIVAWAKFIYYIKKYKINLLHNNSSNLFVQTVAARFCRVPVVYHVREIWNTRSRFSRLLYWFICRASSSIICITEAVKEMNFSEQEKDRFSQKFSVVYDCTEDIFIENALPRKSNNEVIITYMGRMAPIKGVDILLKALAIVSQQSISSSLPVRLRVVGDVPKNNSFYNQYKLHLFELADQCNDVASYAVEFLGFRTDVWNLLAESHLLVLPSRIEEGLGLVLAEGALADNYLITSNLGGQKEIIELLGCGHLFDNDNSSDLALKIQDFLANANQYDACISTAKRHAKELFSPQVYRCKLLAIYENLCSAC
jgi:glycosyltransferase involved in cell wall biosynthesis